MTMPHLMNCLHSEDGWCLACVGAQHGELQSASRDAARYRWLRDGNYKGGPYPAHRTMWVVQYHHPQGTIPELRSAGHGVTLDLAIDVAMAARPS